jgi:hypothetical protein
MTREQMTLVCCFHPNIPLHRCPKCGMPGLEDFLEISFPDPPSTSPEEALEPHPHAPPSTASAADRTDIPAPDSACALPVAMIKQPPDVSVMLGKLDSARIIWA